MKLLAVISSTLLFVLISQQFTSALPIDETMIDVTTEIPHVEHSEKEFVDLTTEMPSSHAERGNNPIQQQTQQRVKKELVDLTTEMPSTQTEREIDEPVEESKTTTLIPEQVQQVKKEFVDLTTEMPSSHAERGNNPAQQQTQQRIKKEFVDLTTEMPSTHTERETEEPIEVSKTEQSPQSQEPHAEHTEQDAEDETGDKKKRGQTEEKVEEPVEEEKTKKTKEEKVEEPVEEEKTKKTKEEKVEEPVEEEKTKKVEGEKTKPSDFCPENYVKFEDSCLFVGSKTKIAARSGKTSTSKTDSTLVENFPVGDDNSCPPGSEYTERGVCQKILTEAESKAKKIAHSCPQNAEFVNGQCIFHSFDMMTSTMEMPLETSERPEIPHEESIATATESKPMIKSEFETTMQSVIKS